MPRREPNPRKVPLNSLLYCSIKQRTYIQRKEREFWALEMPLNTFLEYKARGKSSEDIKIHSVKQ